LDDAGGQGGGLLELALMAEQFGRSVAPSGAWMSAMMALPALAGHPEIEASIVRGESTVAVAVDSTKPADAGTAIHAEAGTSGGFVIDGTVATVLAADSAEHLVVPARTPSGPALFLVSIAAGGTEIRRRKLLDRSRTVADVTFDNAPATRLDAPAAEVLAAMARRAAVLIAADSLGASERMLELAVEYGNQREQFGVPIGSFQAMKHAAATMLVSVEAARSIVYFAAASVELGHDEADLHAATAKAQVTASAVTAADSALTMHGAVGYTWEHDLQLFYKRAKLNAQLFGAPSVWNERIATALPLVPAAR
jgi:alkylation response protein AidB-like acyl-CoA dehydrogenase